MLAQTFAWWLAIEVIGLLALPIVLVVFRRLPGRGVAFAKPVGLLLGGYLFWLALSLHLLPNRPGSIIWALLPVAAVSGWLIWRRWPEFREAVNNRLAFVIAVEALFFVAMFVAAFLKSYVPEIGGTEKPMDFMLLNAADRSQYYTPDDPWLAGFGVSYYYFGYVIQSMLAKLTAVPNAVAFNLALAGTAALAVTAAFGLGYEIARLVRRVSVRAGLVVGVFAVVLVALIGNLEGVLEFGAANGYLSQGIVERVDIANLETAQRSGACVIDLPGACIEYPTEQSSFWWWWRATRISPDGGSITEFPFFSFLLGDLHPHVMAIPFVLSVFGLGLSFWASVRPLDIESWRRRPALLLVSAVLLGGLGFLNTWDLPTIAFLMASFVALRNLVLLREARQTLRATAGFLAPLIGLAFVLYAPFYLSFSSQASGLAAVDTGATRPLHSALFWGPLVLVSLPLPLALLWRGGHRLQRLDAVLAAGVPAVLLLVWAGVVLVNDGGGGLSDAISARGWNWSTFLFFAAGLAACLLALRRVLDTRGEAEADEVETASLAPVLAVMATALLLILGAELFFIRDVFSSRLNTVFKLSYQAWLLLGVSGAYGIWWLASRWQPQRGTRADLLRGAWMAAGGLVLTGALLYPLGATLSRTEALGGGRTLDGLESASVSRAEDVTIARWLADRAGLGERIVEAPGGQYSDGSRISAWTGVPAIVGWPGHEVQWGRDGLMIGRREADVERIYTSDSLAEALEILRKYDVTYVVVGAVERATYPEAGLAKFESLVPVHSFGDSVIYRTPVRAPEGVVVTGE